MDEPVPEVQEKKKDKVVPDHVRGFLAGTASGISKLVTGHPLDTIKVRLQIEGSYGRFKGPLDCLAQTWRQEGIRGLYKGATPPLIGWSCIDTLMIGTYHAMRRVFMQQHERAYQEQLKLQEKQFTNRQTTSGQTTNGQTTNLLGPSPLSLWEVACSGTVAGWVSCIIVTPFEQVKARLQVQYADPSTIKYKGPIHCVRSLVHNNGVMGLYWGFWATVSFRSFMGLYFASYECYKRYIEKLGVPLPIQSLICGGAAATSLWLVAYPTDVVKNRMMAQSDTKERSQRKYKNVRECWKSIYKTEGIKGFYKGFTPCLIRSIPANSSAFLAIELVMKYLP